MTAPPLPASVCMAAATAVGLGLACFAKDLVDLAKIGHPSSEYVGAVSVNSVADLAAVGLIYIRGQTNIFGSPNSSSEGGTDLRGT